MNSFTIKDLENLSGIKAHTIRIWEQRYSFIKPERTGTNIRYYSNDELKKILNVALLNKYGYKISHIDKMNDGEIKEKILSLNQMEAQQERIVNELIQSMVDIDIEKLELILDKYILARGIERTITQIIFPFLEKIGILWLTNHINPAQEHLVTNIIRQKLIVGIDGIVTALKVNKTVVLFLPEGEYHELGLLFMYYLLKSRGVTAIYLGSSVPLKDVEYVVKLKKPDYLYSHLTTVGQNFNFDKFISNVTQKFAGIPIIISGQLTCTYQKKIHPPLNFKRSFAEVMEFVSGFSKA
jgi:MerR family transcriptional regulator, light-induced transcriptional regulator